MCKLWFVTNYVLRTPSESIMKTNPVITRRLCVPKSTLPHTKQAPPPPFREVLENQVDKQTDMSLILFSITRNKSDEEE